MRDALHESQEAAITHLEDKGFFWVQKNRWRLNNDVDALIIRIGDKYCTRVCFRSAAFGGALWQSKCWQQDSNVNVVVVNPFFDLNGRMFHIVGRCFNIIWSAQPVERGLFSSIVLAARQKQSSNCEKIFQLIGGKMQKNNRTVNYAELYEFCFEWMMGERSIEKFSQLMMPFSEFKAETMKRGWWDPSMCHLTSILPN